MKVLLTFILALLFISCTVLSNENAERIRFDVRTMKPLPRPQPNNLCPLCTQLMSQALNQLLNIILQGGVIGSCAKLCSYLDKEGKIVVTACNLLCDYVGVQEFIKLVKKADLDPIWMCEELKACPIHDCTDPICGEFKGNDVFPKSGRMGTTFEIASILEIFNQTGTGELRVLIAPRGAEMFGDSELVPNGYQKGQYHLNFKVEIKDDPQSEQRFLPGVYKYYLEACEGMCGSKHKHTRRIALYAGNFTVTP